MKKIWFLILSSLLIAWCAKPSIVDKPTVASWWNLPQIQTWTKSISQVQKVKQEVKDILNIKTEESEESELPMLSYESKKWNFSLAFPNSRGFQENVWSSLVVFSREWLSGSDKAQLSISQLAISPDSGSKLSLEEYYSQNKLSIRDVIDDFTEISQTKSKIDWNQSLEVIYKWEKNSQNFQIKQIFFQKSDMIFIITYLASENIFSKYLPESNHIIESIKLK